MTVKETQENLAMTYHAGSKVWVPRVEMINSLAAEATKRKTTSWKKGTVEAIQHDIQKDLAFHGTPPILSVHFEDGSEAQVSASECFLQNERDDIIDDLVRSDFLHEPGILHTLQVRYTMDAIYTYSGQILIATNPHKRLKHLYGPRMMAQYRGIPLGELSPHVYAIAEAAYGAMMMDERRQAILISGESGAGKTESAKMVMQYLAHRAAIAVPASSSAPITATKAGQNKNDSSNTAAPIEEQVLESNPLLEAFGNAKTARNDNSSRFGKFVEIDFDVAGRVTGAAISTYLLERSRVVSIRSPERSFHIFYQLCAGADDDQRKVMRLEHGAGGFRYLSQSNAFELHDVDDAEAFQHTLDAMKIVGLKQEAVDAILNIVAGILHLGNICFVNGDDVGPDSNESTSLDGVVLSPGLDSQQALDAASALLDVSSKDLFNALTTRTIETRGERIIKTLDATAAEESRDALAKSMYSRLFDWLVSAINRKIGALGGVSRTPRTIGILDIYGFECFDGNSFEQLCINLANEKLQQAFNAHVFKGEQAEYAEEGISWSFVDFVDNEDVLELLEGSSGVFSLIDEACRLPRATYQDLAHALRTKLTSNPRFGAPRRDQHSFVIDHYAGEVAYATHALLDKNRDFVIAEHALLMQRSKNHLVRALFSPEDNSPDGEPTSPSSIAARTNTASTTQRRSAFMLSTVGSRFRRQLSGLMTTLGECQPHFIRCIKPNPVSMPGDLTPAYVLEQLRAGGVLEAVRIACAGYPTRKRFLPFAQRYAPLLSHARRTELGLNPSSSNIDWDAMSDDALVDISKRVLYGAGLEGWQVGKTRVFLRAGQLAQLEGARGRVLSAAAVKIQSAWRAREIRQQYMASRRAAMRIQAAWRMVLAQREYQSIRRDAAAKKIQSVWKMHDVRSEYLRIKRASRAIVIQKHWRRHHARVQFLHATESGKRAAEKARVEAQQSLAATTIQANWRRILAQRRAAIMRAQAAKMRSLHEEIARLKAELKKSEEALQSSHAYAQTLTSQLEEAKTQMDSARAEAAAAAGAAGAAAAHEKALNSARELELAHERTIAAIREETVVAKQQYHDAENRAVEAEKISRDLAVSVEDLRSKIARRDEDIASLQQQLAAKEEETKAKMAGILSAAEETALEASAQSQRKLKEATFVLEQELESLRGRMNAVQQDNEMKSTALKDAREKALHLSSRVEALSIRTERLEGENRALTSRESTLLQELENARRSAVRSPSIPGGGGYYRAAATPSSMARITVGLGIERNASSPASTSMATPLAGDVNVPSGTVEFGAGQTPKTVSHDHLAAITALIDASIASSVRLPSVAAWSSSSSSPSASAALYIPQAAWLVHRCLLHWAKEWHSFEVAHAAARIERSIVASASESGLSGSAYWMAASLATGALLKMRAVGLPHLDQLFRLGDSFIGFTDLHVILGTAIGNEVPINVALLLSEEAKRSARRRTPQRVAGSVAVASPQQHSNTTALDEELSHMGGAERHWRALVGGVANVVETLKCGGVPPPAVRAVVWATLRYIDGEFLNALLLRRDCCSVSSAKALSTGLAALKELSAYLGADWCCSPDDASKALERSLQAAKYIIQGKDDCVRKALKNVNILPDLARLCPALTLHQVHRLSEHQHDDWLVGAAAGTQNMVLLETLRRLMMEQRHRMVMSGGGTAAVPAITTAMVTPSNGATRDDGQSPLAITHDEEFMTPENSSSSNVHGDDTVAESIQLTSISKGLSTSTPSARGWIDFGAAASLSTAPPVGMAPAKGKEDDDEARDDQGMEEEDLLVDSKASFELFRTQHPLTRRLLTDAARSFVQANAVGNTVRGSPGAPRLPDGSLPRATSPYKQDKVVVASSPAPSGLSLLDAIDRSCMAVGLPDGLKDDASFDFLF